mgnify:FL=1
MYFCFMKLLKKLILLELTVVFFIFVFNACETDDNCKTCFDCTVMANDGTFCESNFDPTQAFNEAIAELVSGGCNCE